MNDTTKTNDASPVSAAFGEHPLTKNEVKPSDTPPETVAHVAKDKAPAKKVKAGPKKLLKAPAKKAEPKAKPAPKAKVPVKKVHKAKPVPKAKPAPAKKAVKVAPKAKPKAPKSVVKRVGGDNKILFTFRIADTMLADINALAAVHSMTPAALIRGALNAFLDQNGPKRGRAK